MKLLQTAVEQNVHYCYTTQKTGAGSFRHSGGEECAPPYSELGRLRLDIALISRYHTSMSTENKEKQQKMSIYFPLDLLMRVRQAAAGHKRSFNKEVLWLVEQALEQAPKANKG